MLAKMFSSHSNPHKTPDADSEENLEQVSASYLCVEDGSSARRLDFDRDSTHTWEAELDLYIRAE